MNEMTVKTKIKKATSADLRQVAALPVRERDGRVELCLITTRETGRWTLPKGWPMKGRKDFIAARIEAEQEAGVTGRPGKKPIGSYLYWKRREGYFDLVKVTVYPLIVTGSFSSWKERAQRQVHWASLHDASIVVDEPGLAALLLEIEAMQLKLSARGISTKKPWRFVLKGKRISRRSVR